MTIKERKELKPENVKRGVEIKALRDSMNDSKGMSLKEFAALIPVDYHTLMRWEHGEFAPLPLYDERIKSIAAKVKPAAVPLAQSAVSKLEDDGASMEHKKPFTKRAQVKVKE
jgi:DNA-binding transcriptional regulator YiaG